MSVPIGYVRRPPLERFADLVAIEDESGCWLWTASTNGAGYGQFQPGGRVGLTIPSRVYAHRWSYEYFVGPIPDGLVIDHLCRTPACVNPEHLDPVTQNENILRGTSPAAIAARRTHCPQGHPYTGSNLYVYPTRRARECRECRRERNRQRRNQNKAA